MFKLIKTLILLSLLTCIAYFSWIEFNESQLPAKRFSLLWQKDLDYLSTLKGFPKWDEIKSPSFITGNHLARSLLLQANIPKQLNELSNDPSAEKSFDLEIVIVSWNDKKETGVVLQYELLDSKTKNKQWEFSRTLTF